MLFVFAWLDCRYCDWARYSAHSVQQYLWTERPGEVRCLTLFLLAIINSLRAPFVSGDCLNWQEQTDWFARMSSSSGEASMVQCPLCRACTARYLTQLEMVPPPKRCTAGRSTVNKKNKTNSLDVPRNDLDTSWARIAQVIWTPSIAKKQSGCY